MNNIEYERRASFQRRPLARSASNYSREMIRCPTPPPIYERFVERAPTPEPEIIERVSIFIIKLILIGDMKKNTFM